MNTYLGIDLGTSVLKAVLIDDTNRVTQTVSKPVVLLTPYPGYAEQQPEIWWEVVLELLTLLAKETDLATVKGIGLAGQMHGLVTYDASFSPVKNAITWLDQRAAYEVERLRETIGARRFYEITGNPLVTGWLLPSLLWIKNNEPVLYEKIETVSSPKDYLAYKLTGVLRSEGTDALATGAFDYRKSTWSKKILTTLGITPTLFPELRPTAEAYGTLSAKIASSTGLPVGIPVFGGSDQSMAAIGLGLLEPGQAAIALSTGGQCLLVAPKGVRDSKRRLHTLNHALADMGLYMGATLAAALSLQWFKQHIIESREDSFEGFTAGIEQIEAGSKDLFYLPFLSGERTPYFNPHLRGAFIGLTLAHTRLHLVRAIMEGVAFSIKECMVVFEELNLPVQRIIVSGGGAKNGVWRQILADVLNRELEMSAITDHSPVGAALFAKYAHYGFDKLPTLSNQIVHPDRVIQPGSQPATQYAALFKHYRAYARAAQGLLRGAS